MSQLPANKATSKPIKKSINKPINKPIKDSVSGITDKELKAFGLMMSWAFPLFIGVIAPWLLGISLQWWTLWVSAFFITLAFLAPKWIYVPYKVWMFIGGIIGFINTRIILGLTFYFLIFPIGLTLKLFNKLQFKNSRNCQSNYVKRTDELTKDTLENPF